MIPELIGRLPIITALAPLDVRAMVRILNEPKNALVRQYQKLFEFEGCQLQFTKGALQLIATKALARETGAEAEAVYCDVADPSSAAAAVRTSLDRFGELHVSRPQGYRTRGDLCAGGACACRPGGPRSASPRPRGHPAPSANLGAAEGRFPRTDRRSRPACR